MFIIYLMALVILTISDLVMLIANILSKKLFTDRENNSPFKCGFDPFNSARIPFSIQFFMIAVIFLILDVEIALLIPMIPIIKIFHINTWFYVTVYFNVILLLGLYHEWNQGALNWAD